MLQITEGSLIVRGAQKQSGTVLCSWRADRLSWNTSSPWLMIPTWVAIWSISERRWLEIRTVMPNVLGRDEISSAFLNTCRVQAVGRLVQKKNLRIPQKSGGQAETLFHTQRILADFFVLLILHAYNLQDSGDFCFREIFQRADDLQIFFST